MPTSPLLQPLISTLEEIRLRITLHAPLLQENETRTRRSLIDPLLDTLGWDTQDPKAVIHEYKISTGCDPTTPSCGTRNPS